MAEVLCEAGACCATLCCSIGRSFSEALLMMGLGNRGSSRDGENIMHGVEVERTSTASAGWP